MTLTQTLGRLSNIVQIAALHFHAFGALRCRRYGAARDGSVLNLYQCPYLRETQMCWVKNLSFLRVTTTILLVGPLYFATRL